MKKFDVVMQLETVREAHKKWVAARRKFSEDEQKVMTRLLHEACANFMSVEEIAAHSGFPARVVRNEMRRAGLDPKQGKRVLSKQAAEALATNSELLGIAPHEMDLMSPLAYLPAGEELRQQITDLTTEGVTELDECPMCEHESHGDTDCGVVVGYDHLNGDHECGCPGVSGNRDELAAAIYGDGTHPDWLTTVDGSPNTAAYELADRVIAAGW